jgi:serine/threonine protein kinase/WD40 repeat protein
VAKITAKALSLAADLTCPGLLMNDPEIPTDPTTDRGASPTRDSSVEDLVVNGQERNCIGEYQLIRRIGGGGMGVVYEALHTRLKRRVAVKLISESYLLRDGASRRFFREMEAAGRLDHPHIVKATDAGVADGIAYLVMELVRGSNLAQIIRQYGALPPRAAMEAIGQAAMALGHIHAHGMVHRDLKPSNLLLNEQGQVKVADLGVAHLIHPLNENDEVTTTGDVVGTVDYMAPEQSSNSKLSDPRSDIYSLGCCMHFLFCASPVFRAESRVDRLIAHRSQSATELSSCCGFPLPKSVNRLFQDMLAKDPQRRPQSVGEVLMRLSKCQEDLKHAFAHSSKQEARQMGNKSIPLDAGLQAAARLLTDGVASDDSDRLTTTIQFRPESRRPYYRHQVVAGLLLVAPIGAYFARDLFLPLGGREQRTTRPGAAEHVATTDRADNGSTSAPMTQFVLDAHPRAAVFNVHFSEDGQQIVSCGSDGLVRVWDIASRQRVGQMQHERGLNGVHVIDMALLPNSPLAVSVCYSGVATVWDWKQSKKLHQFEHHRNQVEGVAWITGTKVLTTGRDDALYLWDAQTGNVVSRLDNLHAGGVRAVAVNAAGRRAITADYNGTILLWNLDPGHEQLINSLQPVSETNEVWCVDWVPGTNLVALGGVFTSGEPLLIVYDTVTRQVVHKFSSLTGRVYGVCASRDGRHLFSAADNVHGWSLQTESDKPIFEFADHNDNVFSVDESPDGTLLATAGTDGTVRVFQWHQLLQ